MTRHRSALILYAPIRRVKPPGERYTAGVGRNDTAAMRFHKMRFPGESPRYRAARNRLLEAERDLRRQVEKVAGMRRKVPLGGLIPEDYVFEEGAANTVRLSELFRDNLDTLVLYSFMFGPDMKRACPMCTSFIDSLNGAVEAVTGIAPLETVPDTVVAAAEEIEFVDITPQQLRARIADAQVLAPGATPHALTGFYTAERLAGLRELAMEWLQQRNHVGPAAQIAPSRASAASADGGAQS